MQALVIVLGLGLLVVGVLPGLFGNAQVPGRRPRALHARTKALTAEWADTVRQEIRGLRNVTASLVLGVIARESGGDANSTGRVGEKGLMQLTEGAVVDYQRETGDPEVPDFDSVEVAHLNIRVGAWFLDRKIEEMGSVFHGLRAYNCGTFGARSNPTCGAEYARWVAEVAEPELRSVA